ncbi:MAG: glycoside hydrolase family 3 N-terminal domain-containing protein [Lachnospiraceae bacterium]|nr:glycoside hydrolase family 3 N-terminal domain-containing protein [Lachnospiraceae bacterium]
MDLQKAPYFLREEQCVWVKQTLDDMTEEEKIGQLFCILGDVYEQQSRRELIQKYGIGGILFRPDTLENIQKKYREMEKCARIPLLKAANLEEGGAGVLTDGTYFGSQMQVAAADDMECTRNFARVCARQGREAGVNWTFSPVVDIDYNFRNPITNVRTFGNDPDTVLKHASVFVRELQKHGLAASCKHFPGDGVDYRDQHLHPTYNDLSAEEWFSSYGKIYESLIKEGLLSIMVGHIVQPNVIRWVNPEASEKDELPASLSREMLTGVLRERFGFQGVIITDATIMGGYTMAMARREAIPASIQAGCDMICFSTDVYEDIRYVKEGLQNGILTGERLDEAVTRILALKARVTDESRKPHELDEISFGQCGRWAEECADQAITLVKDIQQAVPVRSLDYPKIRLTVLGEDRMFDGSIGDTAQEILEKNGFQVERYDPFADDLHGSAGLPEDRLTLILANYQTASNNTTVRISWCPKHAMEIPRFVNEEKTVFISFANPYHLQDVPRVRTYVNAYSATRATVCGAIEKLIGNSTFRGISPTDPFCGLPDTHC